MTTATTEDEVYVWCDDCGKRIVPSSRARLGWTHADGRGTYCGIAKPTGWTA